MAYWDELWQAIRDEARLGFQDNAVQGGFTSFVKGKIAAIPEESQPDPVLRQLKQLVQLYQQQDLAGRRRAVLAMANLVKQRVLLAGRSQEKGSEAELQRSVATLAGVGDRRAELLRRLGITTISDLLWLLPRRYEDRRQLLSLSQLTPGIVHTVQVTVDQITEKRVRPRLQLIQALVRDHTGYAQALWFNQDYLLRQLKPGMSIIITGKVVGQGSLTEIRVVDHELVSREDRLNTGRLVPCYPATAGLSQRVLRQLIYQTLQSRGDAIPTLLPLDVLRKYQLMPLLQAFVQIHFPTSPAMVEPARQRLVWEELMLFQVALALYRRRNQQEPGISLCASGELQQRLRSSLPFPLTQAQERVIAEIQADMEGVQPMSRLVQGDVGSGKTVVAVMAMLQAVEAGYQAAYMAPTEILAEQQFMVLDQWLGRLGLRIAALTGATARREREAILSALASGELNVLVGTHALIQDTVKFHTLGLAVVDEQHRFGVRQRAALKQKGALPDLLVMTATPIPRTLALTFYGDLDLSIIDELPPGRQPVVTRMLTANRRPEAYRRLRQELSKGRQGYVICPLIAEDENGAMKAATELAAELRRELAPIPVGLLHGRLPAREKELVMQQFRAGELPVLVATTVVEVGVDVANATVMIIEGAERFGLAQLHQLRGRVGRGQYPATCLLVAEKVAPEGRARLQALCRVADGFQLAEEDLKLRGPGDLLGTRQHGLPEFRAVDLVKDTALLEAVRATAQQLVKNDPSGTQHLELFNRARQIWVTLDW